MFFNILTELMFHKNNYYKLNKYMNIKNIFNQLFTEQFCKNSYGQNMYSFHAFFNLNIQPFVMY